MGQLGKSGSKAQRQQALSDKLDDRSRAQTLPSLTEQEKASKALVDANSKNHEQKEETETNAVLSKAAELGEKLSSHNEFVTAMQTAIQAKEDDDYKAIAALKWMEKYLTKEDLKCLPWPGSTKAEVETKPRKPGGSNILYYDKIQASGGRRGVESFYKTLVQSTPTGKDAFDLLKQVSDEDAQAQLKPSEARRKANRDADRQKANRAVNQQLSALRTAAKVFILLEEMKEKLPHISIQWVREDIDGEIDTPEDIDHTQVSITGLGEVVHSNRCLLVYSKRAKSTIEASMSTQISITVGAFIRWRIDRAIELSKKDNRKFVNVDDLIGSAKAVATKPQTPVVSTARDVRNWTELVANLDAIVAYEIGDMTKQQGRYVEFRSSLGMSDDVLYSSYSLYKILRAAFEGDPSLEVKAKQVHEARKAS